MASTGPDLPFAKLPTSTSPHLTTVPSYQPRCGCLESRIKYHRHSSTGAVPACNNQPGVQAVRHRTLPSRTTHPTLWNVLIPTLLTLLFVANMYMPTTQRLQQRSTYIVRCRFAAHKRKAVRSPKSPPHSMLDRGAFLAACCLAGMSISGLLHMNAEQSLLIPLPPSLNSALQAAACLCASKGRRPQDSIRESPRMRRRRDRRERRRIQTRTVQIWPLPRGADSAEATGATLEPMVSEPLQADGPCSKTHRCRGGGHATAKTSRDQPSVAYGLLNDIHRAFDASGGLQYDPGSSVFSVGTTVRDLCDVAWERTAVNWHDRPTLTMHDARLSRPRDRTYHHYMRKLQPDWQAMRNNIKVLHSTGDGNCFFNSASIMLEGDESCAATLRLHTAIEVLTNPHQYLGTLRPSYHVDLHPHARSRTNTAHWQSNLDLGNKYIRELLPRGSWVCPAQASPLAAVLGRAVRVCCPFNIHNYEVQYAANSAHAAVTDGLPHEPLTIAWANTGYAGEEHIHGFNHFVPVVSTTSLIPGCVAPTTHTLRSTRFSPGQPPLAAAGNSLEDGPAGSPQFLAAVRHPQHHIVDTAATTADSPAAAVKLNALAPANIQKHCNGALHGCSNHKSYKTCVHSVLAPPGVKQTMKRAGKTTKLGKLGNKCKQTTILEYLQHVKPAPTPLPHHLRGTPHSAHCPSAHAAPSSVCTKRAWESPHGSCNISREGQAGSSLPVMPKVGSAPLQPTPTIPETSLPCRNAPAQGSKRGEEVRLACINIRGSTSANADIQCMLNDLDTPDALILTETKRKKPQFMSKDISLQYATYHSTTSSGNGGVMMLVHKKYAKVGATAQQEVPNECKGYILHVTVGMPYTATLHLVGVYMPCDEAHAHMRPALYSHLAALL